MDPEVRLQAGPDAEPASSVPLQDTAIPIDARVSLNS